MHDIGTYISYFNPFDEGFSQATRDFKRLDGLQKAAAVAAAIFAGLASFFVLGIGSVAAFRKTVEVLKKEDDPVSSRTQSTSDQMFASSSESLSFSDMSFTCEETPKEQLQRISRHIIENRDTLWAQADGNLSKFLDLMRAEFSREGRSLSDTLSDQEILRELCSSGRVAEAIKLYNLRILSQAVFTKREQFTAQAKELAGDDEVKILYTLTLLIRGFFQTYGLSLSDVLADETSRNLFKQSTRLTIVLGLYLKLKAEPQVDESPVAEERRRERRQQQMVRKRAAEHAGGVGLVTQLGMQNVADDQEQLKRQVRLYLVRNHPDKNSQANMDDVRAANEILQMMKDQQFDLYRAEIVRLRAQ